MEEMFKQARAEGKWFWCHYQDLWFSPDALEKEQAAGSYRWGVVNWKLRDPKEWLLEAEQRRDEAQREVERIAEAIK